jgi:hypothetical protein
MPTSTIDREPRPARILRIASTRASSFLLPRPNRIIFLAGRA